MSGQPTMTYHIDRLLGLVYIEGPDPEHPYVVHHLIHAILADPEYRRGFGVLRDRRWLAAPSKRYIEQNIEFLTQVDALAGVRLAVVVTDPANYGMMRMGSILGGNMRLEFSIFEDMDEAKRWLRAPQEESSWLT